MIKISVATKLFTYKQVVADSPYVYKDSEIGSCLFYMNETMWYINQDLYYIQEASSVWLTRNIFEKTNKTIFEALRLKKGRKEFSYIPFLSIKKGLSIVLDFDKKSLEIVTRTKQMKAPILSF